MLTPRHSLARRGLLLLQQASQYASELNCDEWEFAVEWPVLRAAGLTINDLRWLVAKGFAEHGREVTRRGDPCRQFRHGDPLSSVKKTCFVLTTAGAAGIGELLGRASEESPGPSIDSPRSESENGETSVSPVYSPKWDRERQELRLGETLVKQFKLPSPNQETVLMAFEEESWPPRIDDPLPGSATVDSKQRLHDTIKSLNRHQRHRCIRFMGDGSGHGVRWEIIAASDTPSSRRGS